MEYRSTRFSLPFSSSPAIKKAVSNFSSLSNNTPNGNYIPYYDTYPENLTISLELFQSLAIERLRILKTIEQVLARLNTSLSTAASNKKDEIEKLLRKELKDKLNHLKVSLLFCSSNLRHHHRSCLVHDLSIIHRCIVSRSSK